MLFIFVNRIQTSKESTHIMLVVESNQPYDGMKGEVRRLGDIDLLLLPIKFCFGDGDFSWGGNTGELFLDEDLLFEILRRNVFSMLDLPAGQLLQLE